MSPTSTPTRPLQQVLVAMLLLWSLLDYTLQQVGYPMLITAGLLLASAAQAVPAVPAVAVPLGRRR